jgi:hypothetical protein
MRYAYCRVRSYHAFVASTAALLQLLHALLQLRLLYALLQLSRFCSVFTLSFSLSLAWCQCGVSVVCMWCVCLVSVCLRARVVCVYVRVCVCVFVCAHTCAGNEGLEINNVLTHTLVA